jgi:exodeoxyribonuclease-1
LSLIFYDTETSGLSSAFDQILQFAAIRTDDDLTEIGRFEIRSKLLSYIVPSPRAMQVTGQTIDDLLDESRPSHYEMVTTLRRELSGWCRSAFVGYNSLRFDEEFLRAAFYQCLHPPYISNTGGSRRADAMHLIRAAAFLHPGGLVIPTGDTGKPSFKLDRLAPANGFNHINAHDALADVEALIFLCRIVRDCCPALWDRFMNFARKDAVNSFVRQEDAFVMLEFGPTSTKPYVVSAIGEHAGQGNLVYCYDLACDPDTLRDLTDVELAARMKRPSRPLRKLKKNAAPTLCPMEEASPTMLGDVTATVFERRAQVIRSDRALVKRLVAAATAAETEYPPSPFYERQIYSGFWSNDDAQKLEDFHEASWERRAQIAEELEDPRLVWLARRLIWVEQPEMLASEHRDAMAKEKAQRMMSDEPAGWLTIDGALKALAAMGAELEGGAGDRLGVYLAEKRAAALLVANSSLFT